MEDFLDGVAQHISEYTFIDSSGTEYQEDGYNKAVEFMHTIIFPQVDKFIEENYNVKEEVTENEE